MPELSSAWSKLVGLDVSSGLVGTLHTTGGRHWCDSEAPLGTWVMLRQVPTHRKGRRGKKLPWTKVACNRSAYNLNLPCSPQYAHEDVVIDWLLIHTALGQQCRCNLSATSPPLPLPLLRCARPPPLCPTQCDLVRKHRSRRRNAHGAPGHTPAPSPPWPKCHAT